MNKQTDIKTRPEGTSEPCCFRIKKDLWHFLSEAHRPVLLYGTGNGADKILDICLEKKIEVLGVFASDGFVTKADGRRREFREMPILSYSEACERFAQYDFIILLCFATRFPDVIDRICEIEKKHELYVPDVPVVSGSKLFTEELVAENREKISAARNLLADDESRRIFDGIIEGKLTGSLHTLLDASSSPERDHEELFSGKKYSSYADLGAYNGDTVNEFLSLFPEAEEIIAVEPDKKTFKKLQTVCNKLNSESPSLCIETYNAAAWDGCGNLSFCTHGNRGSSGFRIASVGDEGETSLIPALTLDIILGGRSADFIKYDVEGAEKNALLGSAETILRFTPDICLSLYHRSEDLYELPLLLESICPGYRMFLRRKRCLPAWEINLYALS